MEQLVRLRAYAGLQAEFRVACIKDGLVWIELKTKSGWVPFKNCTVEEFEQEQIQK